MKYTITLLAFAFCSILLSAQAPQGINYQAVIRDASGTILTNRTIGLKILILTGGPSGTPSYVETHSVISNAYGLVNLVIGQGNTQVGSFANIPWGSGSHFVEIQTDLNGTSNYQAIGNQQLMSVPYALFAEKTNDDNQTLQISGSNLSISSGNTIVLPSDKARIDNLNTLIYTTSGF